MNVMSRITPALVCACLLMAGGPALAADSMKKDAMAPDAMAKDSMKKDAMKGAMAKDCISKDAMGKDGMAKDAAGKDAMGKVAMARDGASKDCPDTDAMANDGMRKDAMGKDAMMIVHNPWSIAIGDADEMRKMADSLDKVAESISDIYIARPGKSKDDMRAMLDAETWLSADEA
jgi:pentapeptide MXKDX repeat protein